MAEIILMCDGVGCDHSQTLELPDWAGVAEHGMDGHSLYCPRCAAQEDWFGELCPGCAGHFPGCAFGRALPHISAEEKSVIRSGRCPYRTNGLVTVVGGQIIKGDEGPLVSQEAGEAVVAGIERLAQTLTSPLFV